MWPYRKSTWLKQIAFVHERYKLQAAMIEFAQMDPNDTLDTFSRWVVSIYFDMF